MSEVLIEFENDIERDGAIYRARAVGRERADGLWEGWVEFEGAGGVRLTSSRETTQPSHETLKYWATGLTHAYLEGALERAASRDRPLERAWEEPLFSRGPDAAPAVPAVPRDHTAVSMPRVTAVLDPFAVHAEGHDLLRDQLGALDAMHLRGIIEAYGLTDGKHADVAGMTDWEMRALILQAVDRTAER
jgi:hypothetical protein